MRRVSALIGAALLAASIAPAAAQSGDQKAQDQKPAAGDLAKEQQKIDQFAEAIRVLGGPASNPNASGWAVTW